jgi:hypothetical protein
VALRNKLALGLIHAKFFHKVSKTLKLTYKQIKNNKIFTFEFTVRFPIQLETKVLDKLWDEHEVLLHRNTFNSLQCETSVVIYCYIVRYLL